MGLIVGASGSGKTSLAEKIFGKKSIRSPLDLERPIIDQFPESFDYETCAALLGGIGLTAVPCWIRPAKTLSNGQRARAEAALLMSGEGISVIDEWTSVVDRTVAKVMSHCVQKYARRHEKQIVLVSCHYDVIEWLNPDWIIDCNRAEFQDRRSLWRRFKRKESLVFDVREVDSSTWRPFSKYHYLTERLPGGKVFYYGLFSGPNQIGIVAFANYVPYRSIHRFHGFPIIYHWNRLVVHPDYCGFGLGGKFVNAAAALMKKRMKCKIMAKFSSVAMKKTLAMDKAHWKIHEVKRQIGRMIKGSLGRQSAFRENIKTFSFEYVG